ncbi:MAG TPA: hypothetical protein VMI54_03455 [Polyangiaceae bacterium]|nr:hypothetical protein [Polyangiaceae bacterium]
MSSRISLRLRALRAAGLALVLAAAGTACKKNDGETAAGGYVQGQVGVSAAGMGPMAPAGVGGAPAYPMAAGGAAPMPAPTAVPTAGPTAPPTQAGPIAQRLDASAAAAVQPIIAGLVKDNVQPGAKPVGELLVGNFTQGQTLDVPIQLQPNKCYTVVATGLPPVTEVNIQLQLTTIIPGMTPILAVDQDTGATAVLGKKTACYRWMFGVIPAPGKVVVQVTGGSGVVAAQAYEK